MSLTIRLLNYLSRQSRSTIWLICLFSLLVLGVIDYVTGTGITLSFFYLLPVSVAAWSLGKRPGQLIALLSALVMQSGSFLADFRLGWPIILWNTAVRLSVVLVVANLISDFRRLLKHQTELSLTDPLTDVLNRRAFGEAGEAELLNMSRHNQPLTFAFIDIDDFKVVNDSLGHTAGDRVLVMAADCLKSQLWGTDILARLGGDEFGVLLPNTYPAAARKVVTRLRDSLMHAMADANWPVTFSIGVVTCAAAPANVEDLVHLADQLMYAAKRRGKDHIEYSVYPEAFLPEELDSEVPAAGPVPEPQ